MLILALRTRSDNRVPLESGFCLQSSLTRVHAWSPHSTVHEVRRGQRGGLLVYGVLGQSACPSSET